MGGSRPAASIFASLMVSLLTTLVLMRIAFTNGLKVFEQRLDGSFGGFLTILVECRI